MNIGLIGAENSHARHFCNVINGEKRWPDVAIRTLYGADNPEEAQKLCKEFNIILCDSEEEVIAKSDAVAVTYRKGSQHHEPVLGTIKAGKPIFNDKPFATTAKDAKEIVKLAKENGVLLTGGTNLKGLPELATIKETIHPGSTVVISFAADPQSPYDGYWFYGIHSAEICLALCGTDVISVNAIRNKSSVLSHVHYSDKQVILTTATQSDELVVTVTNGSETVCHNIPMNYQSVGPQEFVHMIKTGKAPWDYTHFEKAVELVSRIIESAGLDTLSHLR